MIQLNWFDIVDKKSEYNEYISTEKWALAAVLPLNSPHSSQVSPETCQALEAVKTALTTSEENLVPVKLPGVEHAIFFNLKEIIGVYDSSQGDLIKWVQALSPREKEMDLAIVDLAPLECVYSSPHYRIENSEDFFLLSISLKITTRQELLFKIVSTWLRHKKILYLSEIIDNWETYLASLNLSSLLQSFSAEDLLKKESLMQNLQNRLNRQTHFFEKQGLMVEVTALSWTKEDHLTRALPISGNLTDRIERRRKATTLNPWESQKEKSSSQDKNLIHQEKLVQKEKIHNDSLFGDDLRRRQVKRVILEEIDDL